MTNRQRQHLLGYLGYYSGNVDGIWGPKSVRAMEAYRKEQGQKDLRQAVAETAEGKDFWEEIQFFTREEFRCTCGGRGCDGFPAEPRERLVRNADAARKHFGRAAVVSSGVRCPLRNGELPGSAVNSLHLTGRAMDFRVVGVSSKQLLAFVRTLPETDEAYAIDDSYIHMGVEKNGGGKGNE